jgi:hypothetical protein
MLSTGGSLLSVNSGWDDASYRVVTVTLLRSVNFRRSLQFRNRIPSVCARSSFPQAALKAVCRSYQGGRLACIGHASHFHTAARLSRRPPRTQTRLLECLLSAANSTSA